MNYTGFSGSYDASDVIFLLKDISSLINEEDNLTREIAMSSGTHYSEMLPIEYHPSEEYMNIFYKTLEQSKSKIADLIKIVSEKIISRNMDNLVLVSLARAGTPIGILIKRYIKVKYKLDLPHYSISIIRDKGADKNALKYIIDNHADCNIQFIDGWTGKGVIQDTLISSCEDFYKEYKIKLDPTLAVLSDPAYAAKIYGTREDILIPSACLNSTVSGLVSRTVHNDKFIFKDDFHGAKFYSEWSNIDVSNFFIDEISKCFNESTQIVIGDIDAVIDYRGLSEVNGIKELFNIKNINHIKPGVGETTRVLLRRVPWKILVNSLNNPNLTHIYKLAEDRDVPIMVYKDMSYSCCGIIMEMKK
ncbi:MAG: cysteine protease StiP family protein [Clostridium argentinense]|nr:cysteine protease StiP family protein [Clostridium argentinense]